MYICMLYVCISMIVFMLLCIYVCMYFDFKAKLKCMGQISDKCQ